jgi:hypothetical protein
MKNKKIHSYIDKYLAGKATEAEAALVEEWYQSFENKPGITEQLSAEEVERSRNKSFEVVKAAIGV